MAHLFFGLGDSGVSLGMGNAQKAFIHLKIEESDLFGAN